MKTGRLTVLRATEIDIDVPGHAVVLDDGARLPYDELVVAAGATHSYFGQDQWEPHAPGLKTLADAFDIRARLIGAFEMAERRGAADWLNFVVIGAGPTGVELAGTLVEEFRHIDSRRARVILVEGAPRVLRTLAAACGIEPDRAGRVPVRPDLSLPGHPEIRVIGDLAQISVGGRPVPGVSPAAKQMGRCAARNLVARWRGRRPRDFRYVDYGSLATIGRRAAVVQLELPRLGQLRFSGYAARLSWLFAPVYFLIGFRNRLVVLIDWAWNDWTFARCARVVATPNEPAR